MAAEDPQAARDGAGATAVRRGAAAAAIAITLAHGACSDDGGGDDPGGAGGGPSSAATTNSASTAAQGDAGGPSDGGAPGVGSSASSSAGQGGDASGEGAGGEGPATLHPELYRGGRTHSPITAFVAERVRAIASAASTAKPDVFMKVGASSTVSRSTLFCFAEGPVDLGEQEELALTLQHFLAGDAAGTTPFDRESEAAEVGRSAAWAIAGDPSPVDVERAALEPSLALVHYGTNDMGGGATFESALVAFQRNMTTLVDGLLEVGVVPVIFGVTRRGDDDEANRWVSAFNAASRGVAQREQVPFVDLHHAIDPLPGHGLAGDGLHLESYEGGACVLDAEGLQHGYNVRNLVALEVLDRAREVLMDGVEALDPAAAGLAGIGAAEDPWVIPGLPFAHDASSARGAREVDVYPACSDTDESGPELWYRLELEAPTRLRALVLDAAGVDVDLHLVGDATTGEGCLARGHHRVEATLPPGTYHLAVDTFVDGDVEMSGQYLLVIVSCDEDDAACG